MFVFWFGKLSFIDFFCGYRTETFRVSISNPNSHASIQQEVNVTIFVFCDRYLVALKATGAQSRTSFIAPPLFSREHGVGAVKPT